MTTQEKEIIILLHGIGQTKYIMTPMSLYFKQKEYETINIDYPSLDKSIDRLTAHIHRALTKNGAFKAPKLHFVTHSMGGLVVRSYLARYRPENLGRVVMIAPPNKGSEVADTLHQNWLYRAFYGPAGQELTTTARKAHISNQVDFELGVIAGHLPMGKLLDHYLINEPNDGLVSVKSTKIEGMNDHITFTHAHATLLGDKRVWKQTLQFIKAGAFNKKSQPQ